MQVSALIRSRDHVLLLLITTHILPLWVKSICVVAVLAARATYLPRSALVLLSTRLRTTVAALFDVPDFDGLVNLHEDDPRDML